MQHGENLHAPVAQPGPRTLVLTGVAMLAFAANSLLCRLALGRDLIDPASFTTVRVLAGAIALGLVLSVRTRVTSRHTVGAQTIDWRGVAMLVAYMVCFSFAYRSLSVGTGALLLFAAVQLTMFGRALARGEAFSGVAWAGLALAMAGVVYLVLPGVSAPDARGAALMTAAGIAWGFYSLLGRGSEDPLGASAGNFLWTVVPVVLLNLLFWSQARTSWPGIGLAAASGAVASGLGYVVWYAALRGLTATRAATVQLSVPVIAAVGGVALLGEPMTLRLVLAGAATLGGIALVLCLPAGPRPMRPQV
jgi:drug/metabolite transporter (DMT)-like permease